MQKRSAIPIFLSWLNNALSMELAQNLLSWLNSVEGIGAFSHAKWRVGDISFHSLLMCVGDRRSCRMPISEFVFAS